MNDCAASILPVYFINKVYQSGKYIFDIIIITVVIRCGKCQDIRNPVQYILVYSELHYHLAREGDFQC